MSTSYRSHWQRDYGIRPVWRFGICMVVITKAGDLLTTVIGLVYVDGIVEQNPIAAAVFARAGVLGLLVISVVGIGLLIAVVEALGTIVDDVDEVEIDGRILYYCSYVPLAFISALATVYNSMLILFVV